jgi:hypothetical protein
LIVIVGVISFQSAAVKCIADSTSSIVCAASWSSLSCHCDSIWNALLSIMVLEWMDDTQV